MLNLDLFFAVLLFIPFLLLCRGVWEAYDDYALWYPRTLKWVFMAGFLALVYGIGVLLAAARVLS